ARCAQRWWDRSDRYARPEAAPGCDPRQRSRAGCSQLHRPPESPRASSIRSLFLSYPIRAISQLRKVAPYVLGSASELLPKGVVNPMLPPPESPSARNSGMGHGLPYGPVQAGSHGSMARICVSTLPRAATAVPCSAIREELELMRTNISGT